MAADLKTLLISKTELDPTTGCSTWTGHVAHNGYAVYHHGGKTIVSMHRFAYEVAKGPIPEGLHIDHLCRNRACVNPDHLEAVTSRENVLRGVGYAARNARKTHCARGHEYSPENTHIKPTGARSCRKCNCANSMSWKDRKRAEAQPMEAQNAA